LIVLWEELIFCFSSLYIWKKYKINLQVSFQIQMHWNWNCYWYKVVSYVVPWFGRWKVWSTCASLVQKKNWK